MISIIANTDRQRGQHHHGQIGRRAVHPRAPLSPRVRLRDTSEWRCHSSPYSGHLVFGVIGPKSAGGKPAPFCRSTAASRASAKWARLGAGFGITAVATMQRPLSRHATSSTVCSVLPDRRTANAFSVSRPRPEAEFRGSASQSKPACDSFARSRDSWISSYTSSPGRSDCLRRSMFSNEQPTRPARYEALPPERGNWLTLETTSPVQDTQQPERQAL